jgi:ABC-2 type transport system ATP-binding protein
MTIFLTTQYLEEADALADRVAIIDRGRFIADGSPAELKRAIGNDVIAVRVDDVARAVAVIAAIPGIDEVESRGEEILASTGDGPAMVSPIALALDEAGVRVRALTLRAPTLDDVFLTLTGQHLEGEAV